MYIQVVPSVIAPDLINQFGINLYHLGIISGFFFITYSAMQIPAGILFDCYSIKKVLSMSVLSCSLGLYLFASTQSYYILVVARLIMGLGSAFAFSATLLIAVNYFPKKYFSFLVGITQLMACLGAFSGQEFTSFFLETYRWDNITYAYAIVGTLLFLCVGFVVPNQVIASDIRQSLLEVTKSLLLVLKKPCNWLCAIYVFSLWAPMGVFASMWGNSYLQLKYSISSVESSMLLGFTWAGLGFGAPLVGYLCRNIYDKRCLLFILALIGIVSLSMILFVKLDSKLVLSSALVFLGFSSVGQLLTFEYIYANNLKNFIGTAVGFNNMFMVLSSLTMQPLVGYLLSHPIGHRLDNLDNYNMALSMLLLLYGLALILSLFFVKQKPKTLTAETA